MSYTIPVWDEGTTWGPYLESLIIAGIDNESITPVNRGGNPTQPDEDDLVEGVTVLDASGNSIDVPPGVEVTVQSVAAVIVRVARVPFPPDSEAAGKTIEEIEAYLASIDLTLGNCYDEDFIFIPKQKAKDEGYKGLRFRQTVPPSPDLKVGSAVHVIVRPPEPNDSSRYPHGTRNDSSKKVVDALRDVASAQGRLARATERLLDAIDTDAPPDLSGASGQARSVPQDAGSCHEARFKDLEMTLDGFGQQIRAVRQQIKKLRADLSKKQDAQG